MSSAERQALRGGTRSGAGQARDAADPRPPLGLGVVGCGRVWEAGHAPALKLSGAWRLAAAWDPRPEAGERLRRSHAGVAWAASLEELLGRRDLDAVLVCTPPAQQAAVVSQALGQGCHVLVEKPLGTCAAQAADLLRLAGKCRRQVWVGYTRRFREPYRRLKWWMERAGTGAGGEIHCELAVDPGRWGAVTPYLGQSSLGGDVLADLAAHQVDLLGWLLGRRPRAVMAAMPRPGAVFLDLEMASGPRLTCLAVHGKHYVENLVWRPSHGAAVICHGGGCQHLPRGLRRGNRAWGRAGTFMHLSFCRLTGRPSHTLRAFARQLSAFARAVQGGLPAESGAGLEDALAVWQVLEAARRSLAAGGRRELVSTHDEGEGPHGCNGNRSGCC